MAENVPEGSMLDDAPLVDPSLPPVVLTVDQVRRLADAMRDATA